MKLEIDDGGRAAAGFKGETSDCVCRAIAIATGKPYTDVYADLNALGALERKGKRRRGMSSARTGVYKPTYRRYLESLGWSFVPTMGIGTGCRVHLTDGELPMGRLIVAVSKHLTAVIDGVIHDTHDPQRETHNSRFNDGTPLRHGEWVNPGNGLVCSISRRCVYGYFEKI